MFRIMTDARIGYCTCKDLEQTNSASRSTVSEDSRAKELRDSGDGLEGQLGSKLCWD